MHRWAHRRDGRAPRDEDLHHLHCGGHHVDRVFTKRCPAIRVGDRTTSRPDIYDSSAPATVPGTRYRDVQGRDRGAEHVLLNHTAVRRCTNSSFVSVNVSLISTYPLHSCR